MPLASSYATAVPVFGDYGLGVTAGGLVKRFKAASSILMIPMSTPVNVDAGNIKSVTFAIPAGAVGPKGCVRFWCSLAKIGAVEAVSIAGRFGAAGFTWSGATSAAAFNSGTAVGSYVFEGWVYANGVDMTTLLSMPTTGPAAFIAGGTTQNSLTHNHGTTAWELAIGGNNGATTATWIVTNAQCMILGVT